MKVISQLLEYFVERGALTAQQLQALAKQGLYELPGPAPDAVSTADPLEPLWVESSAPKPRRKGGRGRPKQPVLEQAALVAWIAQSIPKWAPSLEALLRISGEATLDRAAIAIRSEELSGLCDALRQGLKHCNPDLDALWTSLGFDRYREVLTGAKGPVAAAYRAILQCDESVRGSKYAWLLKEPMVRWVYNLALAQRRLLLASGLLYDGEPDVLARALARDNHAAAYAVYVLLHNARRMPSEKIVTRIAAHSSPVETLAISHDGATLFSSVDDSAIVCVWDARSGALAHRLEIEHRVTGLAVSPDGRRLAVQTSEATLDLRDLDSDGHPGLRRQMAGVAERGARFGGSERIAARVSDGAISVWDTATGELRHRIFPELPKCDSLTFRNDGEVLIIGGRDGTTQTFDLETGARRIVERFSELPPKLAFDSERMEAAVIDDHGLSTCRLGGSISEMTRCKLPQGVDSALAYQPNSGWVAVAGGSEAVLVYPLSGEVRSLEAQTAPAEPLRFHFTSGKPRLICAGAKGGVTVWDLESGNSEIRWRAGDSRLLTTALHPHATLLAVSNRAGVTIWDYSTGERVHELPPQRSDILALCFHPHGGQLATGTISGRVKLWDVPSWVERHLAWEPLGVTSMAYHPDGKSLAVGGGSNAGGEVRCWDLATGNPLWWWSGIDGPVHAVAASADGVHVFGASRDVVAAWSLTKGLLWKQYRRGGLARLACCDDGRLVAAGGSDGNIELFNAASGASAGTLSGASSGIKTLEAGPNGLLVSAAEDGEARLWDISLLRWIGISPGGVRSLAISGDGTTIASGTEDGTIHIRRRLLLHLGPNEAVPQRGFRRMAARLGAGSDRGSRACLAPARVLYREYGGVFFAVLIRTVAL
jgi:WD40 repeat protein